MKDLIELKSRGDECNYLRRLVKSDGSESHTYILKTSSYTMRSGLTDQKKKFIEPTGGPMLIEGTKCDNIEAVIKSIDFTIGYGYTITFE